jgi:PadR family transcriptional regulator AphA
MPTIAGKIAHILVGKARISLESKINSCIYQKDIYHKDMKDDPSKRPNQSLFAMLGLLSLGPRTGYELRKLSDESIQHFWRESYGQIYPSLKELESRGWATRRVEEGQGRPDRQVYSLTEEGRAALTAWLEQPVKDEVLRVEILLKLFFGRQSPPEVNLAHVREHAQVHQQLLEVYAATEAHLRSECGDHPDLPYWLLTLSYGRHRSQAILAWCKESLPLLETQGAAASIKGSRIEGGSNG